MRVSISHPTHLRNFTVVSVGPLTLWFLYQTVIGFAVDDSETVASENLWGPTTGKYLNSFSEPEQRVSRETFEALLGLVLARFSVTDLATA